MVKVTIFLKNINDFKAMDTAYREYFKNNPPARTTVQAELYGKGRLTVIDAIAYVPDALSAKHDIGYRKSFPLVLRMW